MKIFLGLGSLPKDTWSKYKPADLLFFSADANRADLWEGEAVDRVLDPLKGLFEDEGYSGLSVSYRGSKTVGDETLTSTLSISRLVILAEMRDTMRNALKSLLGSLATQQHKSAENAYQRLFKRLKPRVIFVLNADPRICSAAGKLRIPVLEVLHARGYGDVYEEWKHRDPSELPDGVVAYDDFSAETFGRLLPTLRVPNFRLPFELEMARQFLDVSPPPFPKTASQYRHVVLFTASYNPKDPTWPGGLPTELVELARENSDVFLLVRLHPVMRVGPQYAKARAALKGGLQGLSNCDTEWASTAPLYAVLGVSTIHFTYASMSSYEAADVGLVTHALGIGNISPESHLQELREKGIVITTSTTLFAFENALRREVFVPNPLTVEASGKLDVQRVLHFARTLT